VITIAQFKMARGKRKEARAKRRLAWRAPGQLSLGEVVTWGGRRAGAGRRRALRANVPHRPREVHRDYQPVHVTLRRAKGVPSLRHQRLERVVRGAMRATTRARDGAFRVTDYSIQNDHVHLIVEADALGHHGDPVGLSRAMRSFVIRVALRLNKALGRKRGRVWGDRFRARELTSPSEVRPPDPSPVEPARTWLLDWGWHRGRDYIHLGEVPRALRAG